MEERNTPQFKILDARQTPVRGGLVVIILLTLAFGWFAVRWQLGNMLAELTLPTDPGAKDIAALAVQLSPGDPMANWLSV
ncbi:MAG: hypothetical protein LH614_00210, partial [Pyrinomonadaceae bacterium]|nr:hypothetical protein [Pyrinomonadaceae bacterium]